MNYQAASDALWHCFGAEKQVQGFPTASSLEPPNPDVDIIGVFSMVGIRYWRSATSEALVRLETTDLQTDSAKIWLEAEESSDRNEVLTCKLVLAIQAFANDYLKPPASHQCPELSRSMLARSLKLSTRSIANMGNLIPLASSFPIREVSDTSCYCVTGSAVQATWSYNKTKGVNRAFITTISRGVTYDYLMKLTAHLQDVSDLPAFIPFLVIDTQIDIYQRQLLGHANESNYNALELGRYLNQRDGSIPFHESNHRIDTAIDVQGSSRALLEMVQHDIVRTLGFRPSLVPENRMALEKVHELFLELISHRARELEILVSASEAIIRQTKVQISSTLGMMAYKQQSLSQQIAKDTKQDGASMKTMAIMAMLYLPSTAVSAVLAIPMFRWDEKSASNIATNKIWIFFVISIPLTIITMLGFRYWLHFDEQAQAKANAPQYRKTAKKATWSKGIGVSFLSKTFWAKLNFSKTFLPKHVKKEVV